MSAASAPAYVPLGQASKLFPPDEAGRSVHVSTLRRWARNGVKTPDGRGVKLGTVKIGHRRTTTLEAVAEFIEELNRPAGVVL